MKRCPKCNRQYNDDSLRFCLEDGSPLAPDMSAEPAATEILPRAQPTLKSSGPTVPSYQNRPGVSQTEVRQSNPPLTGRGRAIALLLLLLVVIVGFFVLRQTATDQSSAQASNATPTPGKGSTTTTKATPDDGQDTFTSTSPAGTPLKITASSSSVRLAVQSNTYYPANTIDGKRSTAWIEGVEGPGIGEWIRFDFYRGINLA